MMTAEIQQKKELAEKLGRVSGYEHDGQQSDCAFWVGVMTDGRQKEVVPQE